MKPYETTILVRSAEVGKICVEMEISFSEH